MIKQLRGYYTLVLGISLTVLGCTQEQPKNNYSVPAAKVAAIMPPFRFHKTIEVSPGQIYDVMSWGRGSTSVGSLLILKSDSAGKNYSTTTGDLEGAIIDVFNSDMDADGNPELLIEAKAKDTINYNRIYAYEFNESKSNKLDFPRLTSGQQKGYRGIDNFYMKDGKLIREFPIYNGNSAGAKPTGQKRILQYNMRSNNLTVKDLSADTLKTVGVKADTLIKKHTEKKTVVKESKKGKKSAKHKKETSKKKKRKHHRN